MKTFKKILGVIIIVGAALFLGFCLLRVILASTGASWNHQLFHWTQMCATDFSESSCTPVAPLVLSLGFAVVIATLLYYFSQSLIRNQETKWDYLIYLVLVLLVLGGLYLWKDKNFKLEYYTSESVAGLIKST